MSLTPAQNATLKAAIEADGTLNAFDNNEDGADAIAKLLNLPASPSFYVWRTSMGVDEVMQNGFDWTIVDSLTIGKARIWDWMMRTGALHPNQANVRAGIIEVFKTAGQAAMRVSIFGHCHRLATRVEKLFATITAGTGTGVAAIENGTGPAQLTFEGELTRTEVYEARNS